MQTMLIKIRGTIKQEALLLSAHVRYSPPVLKHCRRCSAEHFDKVGIAFLNLCDFWIPNQNALLMFITFCTISYICEFT
jgi:hypothetical protein